MPSSLNLATRRYYNRFRLRVVLWLLLPTVCFGSVFGAFRIIALHDEAEKIGRERSQLERTLAASPRISEKERKAQAEKIASINRLLARRSSSPRKLLDLLEQATPNGVSYTRIAPEDKDKGVTLEGQVQNMQTLSLLLRQLEAQQALPAPRLVATGSGPSRVDTQSPTARIKFEIRLGGSKQ